MPSKISTSSVSTPPINQKQLGDYLGIGLIVLVVLCWVAMVGGVFYGIVQFFRRYFG